MLPFGTSPSKPSLDVQRLWALWAVTDAQCHVFRLCAQNQGCGEVLRCGVDDPDQKLPQAHDPLGWEFMLGPRVSEHVQEQRVRRILSMCEKTPRKQESCALSFYKSMELVSDCFCTPPRCSGQE